MLRKLLIAIATTGALASVALCAGYGWDQATVLKDRITSAFIYGMLALFTLALHVAAIRLWVQGWRKLGFVCGAAGFLAFVMTAFASLGGLASRGDAVVAERQDALDAKADIRKQVADLQAERAKLAFARTTKAGVDAAKLKAARAMAAKEAECSPIRGKFCRAKEDAEIEAAGEITRAEANKAATDRADAIDAEVKGLRAKLTGTTTGIGSANPLRELLAVLLGAWADVLTAWQKAAFAVVYDVCLIATMIAIEALGHASAPIAVRAAAARPEQIDEPEGSRETEAASIEPPPQPRLVVSGSARPAGSIPKILSKALEPGKGRIEMADVYAAYASECARLGVPAVSPKDFVDPLKRFCSTCRIKTKVVDGKVYLLDVRLAPQVATLEA